MSLKAHYFNTTSLLSIWLKFPFHAYNERKLDKQGASDGGRNVPANDSEVHPPFLNGLRKQAKMDLGLLAGGWVEYDKQTKPALLAKIQKVRRLASSAATQRVEHAKRLRRYQLENQAEAPNFLPQWVSVLGILFVGVYLGGLLMAEAYVNSSIFTVFIHSQSKATLVALIVGTGVLALTHMLGHALKQKKKGFLFYLSAIGLCVFLVSVYGMRVMQLQREAAVAQQEAKGWNEDMDRDSERSLVDYNGFGDKKQTQVEEQEKSGEEENPFVKATFLLGINLMLVLLGVGLAYALATPHDLRDLRRSFDRLVKLQKKLAGAEKSAMNLNANREKVLLHQRNGAGMLMNKADRLKDVYAGANQYARQDGKMPALLEKDLGLEMPSRLTKDSHHLAEYDKMEEFLEEMEEATKKQVEELKINGTDYLEYEEEQDRRKALAEEQKMRRQRWQEENGYFPAKKYIKAQGRPNLQQSGGNKQNKRKKDMVAVGAFALPRPNAHLNGKPKKHR